MISIGNIKTKGLSLGQGKIKKAFLGSKVVWTKEVVIYTKVTYEKKRGVNYIDFDSDAPNYEYSRERFVKYIIVDGKYKVYSKDIYLYISSINLLNNNPLINIAFPVGTRIVMVFEAE